MAARTPLLLWLASSLAIASGGCLKTGTKVFTHEIGDFEFRGVEARSVLVDLRADPTYARYQHDIERVENVAVLVRVVNRSIADAVVRFWIADEPGFRTLGELEEAGTPVTGSITVPPFATHELDHGEALRATQNLAELQSAVERGSFILYITVVRNLVVVVEDVTLVVTMTVGL
jgi:hypothetical protein